MSQNHHLLSILVSKITLEIVDVSQFHVPFIPILLFVCSQLKKRCLPFQNTKSHFPWVEGNVFNQICPTLKFSFCFGISVWKWICIVVFNQFATYFRQRLSPCNIIDGFIAISQIRIPNNSIRYIKCFCLSNAFISTPLNQIYVVMTRYK